MDLDDLVKLSEENLIPTFVIVGDLLPVSLKVRKGASFYYDESLQNYLVSLLRKVDYSYDKKFLNLEMHLLQSYLQLSKLEEELNEVSIFTPQNELTKKVKKVYEEMKNVPIMKIYENIASTLGNIKIFYVSLFSSICPISKNYRNDTTNLYTR